ncbi:PQQ-dependent sugar dehydrogenase [Runella slithyformis]|uniref:PKD domain containing protein n=1 Tax=Runella slithyformis (strain ATCC 29530 / DSM 19594 / LMG 11500 / NCIMB 11436 / LSU 4) TaxID=761193 RepID=A0A7U4E3W3_RUNSL|nr:PQQ-dependent sugar dehydrogenase [Runella slithyformis]AEI46644.1 PKD domain containing protein [Runella slithyformis DSM 19594]
MKNPFWKKSMYTGSSSLLIVTLLSSAVFAQSPTVPEENRFTKNVLLEKLDEPTELVVLEDQRVLFTERKGKVKLYNPKKPNTYKLVANLPVYTKQEYGLMGINVDPNFKENKWVYLYYSPVSSEADTSQRLVRMKYDTERDTLLPSTEQVLLRVPVKRNDCCHTGGSIAWDKQGNLYLSTGDDINPFGNDGYGPLDGRPGRAGWDGRSSSSNTNDYRGKILRIKPRPEGGYDIPAGNLFPVGTPKAHPEIYIMGNRNPYRISIDQRTGFLYWGEVGPDAGNDSETRGPRGYDEINQARKAGYFGYPLFVADNKAYNRYDMGTKVSGERFDPMKPINDSPHNTGLVELPPAQKAFIYYPYADSPEFGPIVGKGGRNAMAGPVYYYDDYPETDVKFPRHYDGKFFAYEWIRDWIHPVTMDKNGNFVSMETFMPGTKFNHPIDMQFAVDGSLYVMEYGNTWFAQNDDSRLSRITYNAGNRKPVAAASVNKKAGAAPMKAVFSSKGSIDYDGDALTYEWTFGKGLPKSTLPNPTFTYTKPGTYTATLKVTDAKGNTSTGNVEVKVGNEPPKVEVAVAGNKSFYWENKPVSYEVKVADKEDGTLANKKISPEDVTVTIDYLEGFDKTILAQGHQANLGFATGKRLMDLSDCKACHDIDKKSIGPAYRQVAKKYKGERDIESRLADKIIQGGGGVWGEQAMSAHPQIKKDDAKEIVRYIMSLGNEKGPDKKPIKGEYVTAAKQKEGSYIFTASYTDRGNADVGPQTATTTVALRPAKVKAVQNDEVKNATKVELPTKAEVLAPVKNGSYALYKDIDLTDISTLSFMVYADPSRTVGGKIEVRLDSPTGALIGEAEVPNSKMGVVNATIRRPDEKMHNVYLVFTTGQAVPEDKGLFGLEWIQFNPNGVANTGK